MMSETAREVYRLLREAQNKHTYFLLATAGAAIALTVNQSQGAAMTWYQIPLAVGVLSWGLSFFFGCRYVSYINSALYANAVLLQVQSGQHPEVGTHPQMMAAASEGIRQAIESNSEHANRLGHLQFRLLVAGAVLYIVWHILEMYLRSGS